MRQAAVFRSQQGQGIQATRISQHNKLFKLLDPSSRPNVTHASALRLFPALRRGVRSHLEPCHEYDHDCVVLFWNLAMTMIMLV
jgi:hypothetical protein